MANKIEQTVIDHLKKISEQVGDFEAMRFDIDCWTECYEGEMVSPIEQILFISLKAVQRFNYIDDLREIKHPQKGTVLKGISFFPQFKLEDYRVDFLICYCFGDPLKHDKQLIVECDSQQFHDRSEHERRYEKKRDRFLQKEGYKVFRYTGSEIVKNSLEIAGEIIAYVMGVKASDIVIDNSFGD